MLSVFYVSVSSSEHIDVVMHVCCFSMLLCFVRFMCTARIFVVYMNVPLAKMVYCLHPL